MQALVLGATGHIGAHVVRALVAQGYSVRATYRNPRYRMVLEGLPVTTSQLDLEEPRQLRAAVEGCEIVFHCASFYPRFTDRRTQAIDRGVAQVQRVFDVFRASGVRKVVYTSSAATIPPPVCPPKVGQWHWPFRPNTGGGTIPHVSGRRSTEADAEPWPVTQRRSLYSTVKIAMEHAVMRYVHEGLPVVIVNPSLCIGEYDAHPFSGRLVLLFARGRLPVYLEYRFNAIYTGDVGQAHVAAAERGMPGERYLLAAHDVTLREFAHVVASQAGVAPPRWCLPYPLAITGAMMTELAAAITRTEPLFPRSLVQRSRRQSEGLESSKAQRVLGMPRTSLHEAIEKALAWFRHHRYLSPRRSR